jgi:hypothetical protein
MSKLDRNANTHERHRVNWQRLVKDHVTTLTNQQIGEVPTGTINGSNKVFTLAFPPLVGSVRVYRDGLRDRNFTLSGANNLTLTLTTAPTTSLVGDYQRDI